MDTLSIRALCALCSLLLAAAAVAQQRSFVTEEEIRAGLPADGSHWLTFGGSYDNQRHSPLTQITPRNVRRLVPQWIFQGGTLARGRGFEATPLLYDDVLYVTGSNNYAWAAGCPQSSTRRSRNALTMTDTELKLMAAAAIIGLSSKPMNG